MEETTLNEALDKLDEDFELDESVEDDDLEYDEDGNVEIPDDEKDDLDEDDGGDDGDEEADEAEVAEDDGEGEETPDVATAPEVKEDLSKAELDRIKAQAKDTLAKLGVKVEGDDVIGALVKLAAESEDKTPEEYLKDKEEAETLEAAKRLVEEQKRTAEQKEGEAIRKADLEKLHQAFPETAGYDDISKLPNFKRFGELRVLGLSADEAYSASHPNAIRANAVEGAKKSLLIGTKNHLHTSVPKGARDDAITMPKSALAEMRELYPNLKDKEIEALYKRASQK